MGWIFRLLYETKSLGSIKYINIVSIIVLGSGDICLAAFRCFMPRVMYMSTKQAAFTDRNIKYFHKLLSSIDYEMSSLEDEIHALALLYKHKLDKLHLRSPRLKCWWVRPCLLSRKYTNGTN